MGSKLLFFKEKDADLKYLKGKTIAVIGYGSQGKAQALNLKDKGLDVIIGLPKKSRKRKIAKKDGFEVFSTEDATKKAEVISFLAPDHLHQEIFETQIKRYLKKGQALIFAHAFSVHFKLIKPPKYVDVILVAPHGPGELLRKNFQKGEGLTSFFAIHQDYSKNAKKLGLAYAKGCGLIKPLSIKTTFEDEAIGDIFGEQAVLCGGLSELIKSGFETLVEDGFSPENAYFECVYQIDLIVDLIKSYGISGMYERISKLAEYGSYLSGKRVINKDQMKKILKEIKTGKFTRRFLKEFKSGGENYKKIKRAFQKHLLERIASKTLK
ncbi:MAG: hypothetical protein AMJ90_05160 [candidate division Zixibacteria bacterium SM23_73_2]|nr:MAG: hypothetical protein AMJ90_05160 [candidate division Zixibacteria bacterium SM23_73_2]